MIFIITALSAEARPLIQYFKLQPTHNLPFKIYENSDVKLIISNVGYENALIATTALLSHFGSKEDDILLNIGIAAAPTNYAIEALILLHKISHSSTHYYPDILFEHNFLEANGTTVLEPTSIYHDTLVDMEAHAIYKAGSRFLDAHQMAFIKIISDHFEPQDVNKEKTIMMIQNHLQNIEVIANAMKNIMVQNIHFTRGEVIMIENINTLFTKSQQSALSDAINFYKLKHQQELTLPFKLLNTKLEKKVYLEQLIKQLTS